MPTIKIEADEKTPSYSALEAVAMFIVHNCAQPGYLMEREVTIQSGRRLKVEELPHEEGASLCSCSFKVTTLEPLPAQTPSEEA